MKSKKSNLVPIFYACDDNFVKFTIVSMRSLIDNANSKRQYQLYVLNTGISDAMINMTKALETDNVKISFVDVRNYLEKISNKLPIRDYYTKTTYFRLFIAEMYPEYDKALYVDSDTVFLGDVSKLYDTDIKDNYVAACHEQVMVQTDVFGNYVEKVLGIKRNNYFNAGILLINCTAFREKQILDKFIGLLGVYNFVVTQDQDYLNVLCHNKVYWLHQGWNTEVYGDIPVAKKDIKILHYIMVSKPWHYPDCRLKEYFWEYAKKTVVYEEILEGLNRYTDEKRSNDKLSCERLAEIAQNESDRVDRFVNKLYMRWRDVKTSRT